MTYTNIKYQIPYSEGLSKTFTWTDRYDNEKQYIFSFDSKYEMETFDNGFCLVNCLFDEGRDAINKNQPSKYRYYVARNLVGEWFINVLTTTPFEENVQLPLDKFGFPVGFTMEHIGSSEATYTGFDGSKVATFKELKDAIVFLKNYIIRQKAVGNNIFRGNTSEEAITNQKSTYSHIY